MQTTAQTRSFSFTNLLLLTLGTTILVATVTPDVHAASLWKKIKDKVKGCDYSSEERDEALKSEMETTAKLPDIEIENFKESDFQTKPWLKEFKYIVVVNKLNEGPEKETLRLYEYGQLMEVKPVSTGREGFELKRKYPSCQTRPAKSYWSVTPTGYYMPQVLSEDHVSSSWGSSMPYAIFYDYKNGLAMHERPSGTEGMLGSRASGGCTRLPENFAKNFFNQVKSSEGMTVPKISENGQPELDANGEMIRISEQQVPYYSHTSDDEVMTKFRIEPTFGTLIIIQNGPVLK